VPVLSWEYASAEGKTLPSVYGSGEETGMINAPYTIYWDYKLKGG
jgi:hypothetical protein